MEKFLGQSTCLIVKKNARYLADIELRQAAVVSFLKFMWCEIFPGRHYCKHHFVEILSTDAAAILEACLLFYLEIYQIV